MFETIAVTAPTAKPGHRAERVAGEEHDVGGGLHVRDGREGEPADDRERGERGHHREHPRGRLLALVPGEAGGERESRAARARTACQLIARPPPRRRAGSRRAWAASPRSTRAPSSGSSAAPSVTRATSVEKWRPPASTSCGEPSAITTPWPSSTMRSASEAANSVSCVATITAAPRLGELGGAGGQLVLVDAVHPARGLVEQHHRRGLARQHHLQREALALAAREVARIGGLASRQAGARHAGHAGVLDRVVVHQVVARVLEQQRHLARALDAAAGRLGEALREPEHGALAGAVAAHERDALAGMELEVDAAQDGGPSSTSSQTSFSASAGGGPLLR